MLVFKEKGKPEYPEKNLSEQGENQHMMSMPGFAPESHWWEASVLTTAPPIPVSATHCAIHMMDDRGSVAKQLEH